MVPRPSVWFCQPSRMWWMIERAVIWYSLRHCSSWESAPMARVWQYRAIISPISGENGRATEVASS